jgi:hypothetical protein
MSKSHTTGKEAYQENHIEGQSSKTMDDKVKEDIETGKYKYLQAERPDVDKTHLRKEESESETKTSKNSCNSSKQKPDRKKDLESVISDVKESTVIKSQVRDSIESEEEKPRQQHLKHSREIRSQGSDMTESDENKTRQPSREIRSRGRDDTESEEEKCRQRNVEPSREIRSQRRDDTESEKEKSRLKNLKSSREIRSGGTDNAESEDNVLRPRGCQSPSMKRFETVNSAIGQVLNSSLL